MAVCMTALCKGIDLANAAVQACVWVVVQGKRDLNLSGTRRQDRDKPWLDDVLIIVDIFSSTLSSFTYKPKSHITDSHLTFEPYVLSA